MQSPSSLIFLVLLGVWAAYFVQYWVRRRDHVATARSVEQFSEAMRVLERRDPLPRTDLSEPAPRSYAVHPARTARPQVLVKRAVASDPGPIGVTERIKRLGCRCPGRRFGHAAPSSPVAAGPARRPAAVGAGRRRVRPSRRVRGLLLLAAVVELLVIAPLVATSMLPPWALAPALLAVGWAALFARAGVRAEQAMVRATPPPPGRPRPSSNRSAGGTARRRLCAGRPAPRHPVVALTRPPPSPSMGPSRSPRPLEVVTLTEPAPVGTDSSVVEPVVAEAVAPSRRSSPPPTSWCRSSTRTTSR